MKKILSVLLLALLALCLVACAGDKTPGAESGGDGLVVDSDSGAQGNDPVAPTSIDIIKDGVVAKVIYPITADAETLSLVNSLNTTLQQLSGQTRLRPEVEGTNHDPSTVEILIGQTKYPESIQVYDSLGYGEGIVCVVGNKVVVAGFDNLACSRALNSLVIAMNKNKDEAGNVSLALDYSVTYSDRPLVSALPVLGNNIYPTRVENAGQGCSKVTFEGIEVSDVQTYLPKLEAAGYTKHAENQIDENLYYTYYNDEVVVTLMYAARKTGATLSITVDPMSSTSLVPLASENTWEEVTTTTFTQVGLYYDENKAENEAAKNMKNFNGMCYVLRLEDGSFIIMDGGHNTQGHADRLYEVLKKQAPDPDNIVIAAWFFSHDHGDHVGFFSHFAKSYGSNVKVELFVHSFPFSSADNVLSACRAKFDGAKIIKSHAGQQFFLRNATIEILYTSDLYLTNVEEMSDTNNASQVFTITAEGTKFMIFGDYSENGTTMLDLYSKETMKSDVMQIPHHGISGMQNNMNTTVAPTYAFWPVAMLAADNEGGAKAGHVYWKETDRDIDVDLIGRAPNDYFVNTMDYENNVFVANDDVYVATFSDGVLDVTRYETVTDYLAGVVAE